MTVSKNDEKQNYGSLGELTRDEWKTCLDNNEGIFKKIDRELPKVFPGPFLNKEGDVRGDEGGEEVMYFIRYCSTEQEVFLTELLQDNLSAAHEYVMILTGLKERWHKDIRWLRIALNYFQAEERLLHEDEERLKTGQKPAPIYFSEALKRHFPEHFQDMDFNGLSIPEALQRVKEKLQKVEPTEKNLEDYLEKTKEVMPFLFN